MKIALGIIATAALVVTASNASAVTVFKDDKFKFNINGDWQIQVRQNPGIDKDLNVEFDDLELKNFAAYTLTDSLKAIGQVDLSANAAADDPSKSPKLEEAYLGFMLKDTTFLIGKTDSAADKFGVWGGLGFEFLRGGGGNDWVHKSAFGEWGNTSGDDLLMVKAPSIAGLPIGVIASYELAADSEKSAANGEFFDTVVNVQLPAAIKVKLAYQNNTPVDSDSFDIYGAQVSWKNKLFGLGADYSATDTDDDGGGSITGFGCKYTGLKDFAFGAYYSIVSFEEEGRDDVNGWLFNVTYYFNKNVRLLAEIMDTDQEDDNGDDYEMGYMVGMRILF